METPSDIWGFSLFCDDIRHELGAKQSIMGLYNSDMVFQNDPPFQAARLAILVMLYGPGGRPPEDMTLRVFLPGDAQDAPTILIPIPKEHQILATPTSEPPLEPDQQRITHFRFPLMLQPLSLPQAGYIKVRIERAGKIFNFGSLRVRGPSPDEKAAMAAFLAQQSVPQVNN